jgi:hypothetical protein
VKRCRQRSTNATGNGCALGGNLPDVQRGFHELVTWHGGDAFGALTVAVAKADTVKTSLAGNDHALSRVSQDRVRRRLVGTPGTGAAGPTLLLPDNFASEQKAEIVLQNRGDVGSKAAIWLAAEVGNIDGQPTAGLERACALAQDVAQHREVLDVVGRHVAFAKRCLVFLARKVGRGGDDECNRAVGHL